MKKIIFHSVLFIALILVSSVPVIVQAQLPSFIICGQDANNPCRLCHLYILADRLINFILMLIVPLSALMIAWGGIQYILAAGNIGSVDKAKKIIWNGIFCITIAFSAWLIVNTIMSILATGTFTQWNQFPSCS